MKLKQNVGSGFSRIFLVHTVLYIVFATKGGGGRKRNPCETDSVDLSQQGPRAVPGFRQNRKGTNTRGIYDLMGNNPLYIHLAVMKASVNMPL